MDRTLKLLKAISSEMDENSLTIISVLQDDARSHTSYYECGVCGTWMKTDCNPDTVCKHNNGCYFGEKSVDRFIPILNKDERLSFSTVPFNPPVTLEGWHGHVMEKGRWYPENSGLRCDVCHRDIPKKEEKEAYSCHSCHYGRGIKSWFDPGFDMCGKCADRNPPLADKDDGTKVLWMDVCRNDN